MNGLKMAGLMADQLRWAEINEYWEYMERLLWTLKSMGARVIRLEDPVFRWRADYIISFARSDTLPGVISPSTP